MGERAATHSEVSLDIARDLFAERLAPGHHVVYLVWLSSCAPGQFGLIAIALAAAVGEQVGAAGFVDSHGFIAAHYH